MKYLKLWENFNSDEINMRYIELANRIDEFIEQYAGIRPDYDPEYDDIDDKYTSPDAYEMLKCSNMLKNNMKPDYCFSSWAGGGYKPYTSEEGKIEHDLILQAIKEV